MINTCQQTAVLSILSLHFSFSSFGLIPTTFTSGQPLNTPSPLHSVLPPSSPCPNHFQISIKHIFPREHLPPSACSLFHFCCYSLSLSIFFFLSHDMTQPVLSYLACLFRYTHHPSILSYILICPVFHQRETVHSPQHSHFCALQESFLSFSQGQNFQAVQEDVSNHALIDLDL